MSRKLAELFQASGGAAVKWGGQDVHMIYDVGEVRPDQKLFIRFGQPSPARAQSLRIRARGGLVEINGQALDDVVLWSNSTPESVLVRFRPNVSEPMTVAVWNAWRDPAGSMQSWIGNSGLLIEQGAGGVTVLRCSDGFDDPTFDDLVVTLHFSPA